MVNMYGWPRTDRCHVYPWSITWAPDSQKYLPETRHISFIRGRSASGVPNWTTESKRIESHARSCTANSTANGRVGETTKPFSIGKNSLKIWRETDQKYQPSCSKTSQIVPWCAHEIWEPRRTLESILPLPPSHYLLSRAGSGSQFGSRIWGSRAPVWQFQEIGRSLKRRIWFPKWQWREWELAWSVWGLECDEKLKNGFSAGFDGC